jgi:predicted transcriptional regulator
MKAVFQILARRVGRKPLATVKLDGDQPTVVVVHGLVVLSRAASGKNRFSMAGSSNG